MAQGKKTFIFYSDWTNMIKEMPDNDAGQLLKHILSYVNDEDPTTDNILVKMAFGHMKPMLKKDLEKWNKQLIQFSKMGKKSAKNRIKSKVEPTLTHVEPTSTVNVNDNVNGNDNVNKKKKTTKIIFPFNTESFKQIWEVWKTYKKDQHKFTYKSAVSEQAALKQLGELSKNNEITAKKIIERSIANGWSGHFELKKNEKGRNSTPRKTTLDPTSADDIEWFTSPHEKGMA